MNKVCQTRFVLSLQNDPCSIIWIYPFFASDSVNDSNQYPDVSFYDDISSLETSYLSPSEIDKNFQNLSKESFTVFHLNIRSMNKNFEAFQDFYKSLNTIFSIICLTERWINDSNINQNSTFQLEEYTSVHKTEKVAKEGKLLYLSVIHFRINYAVT